MSSESKSWRRFLKDCPSWPISHFLGPVCGNGGTTRTKMWVCVCQFSLQMHFNDSQTSSVSGCGINNKSSDQATVGVRFCLFSINFVSFFYFLPIILHVFQIPVFLDKNFVETRIKILMKLRKNAKS